MAPRARVRKLQDSALLQAPSVEVSDTKSSLDAVVVICTYSTARWDTLALSVRSAFEQTRPPKEVIVVVDHNADLFRRARVAFPEAIVIENNHAQGLSGGRNTGWKATTASIVAFLDDDAVASPEWLERLLAEYADQPAVVAVGGSSIPEWSSGRPSWFPAEYDWVVGCSYAGLPLERSLARNLIGSNMSFRRASLSAVGGFSNALGRRGSTPTGCEETELCIRLTRHDRAAKVVYVPSSVVSHLVPVDRSRWRYFRARCYFEGLSKARVAAMVGHRRALEVERRYVRSVLPRAVLSGLLDGLRGDVTGFSRAGAVIAGLAFTASGYVAGRVANVVGRLFKSAPSLS